MDSTVFDSNKVLFTDKSLRGGGGGGGIKYGELFVSFCHIFKKKNVL